MVRYIKIRHSFESVVIPGMTAVFLAGMTRNPGIWCRQTGFPRSREWRGWGGISIFIV